MIGTGLAILGSGLIGAGASMYGASKAASAQEKAAAQAAAAQQQAIQFQRENYEKASGNLSPFIQTGQGANNLLSSFYGLNGADPALGDNALAAFAKSPDFKFAMKEGIGALDNSAAAKGGLLSGNQLRAVTEYGSGLATQNLTNYLSRLSGLSGQGIQAGGMLGQIGSGTGSNINTASNNLGNAYMAGGTAEASGILGMTKGFNSGLNSLSLYNQMSQSAYKPSNSLGGTGFSLTNTGGLY
jgi:type II secretory pathway pseudopilin PulG